MHRKSCQNPFCWCFWKFVLGNLVAHTSRYWCSTMSGLLEGYSQQRGFTAEILMFKDLHKLGSLRKNGHTTNQHGSNQLANNPPRSAVLHGEPRTNLDPSDWWWNSRWLGPQHFAYKESYRNLWSMWQYLSCLLLKIHSIVAVYSFILSFAMFCPSNCPWNSLLVASKGSHNCLFFWLVLAVAEISSK